MKERRTLHALDLRDLCIKHSWYTRGTIDEYDNLLELAEKCNDVETETIVTLAKDIKNHSWTDHDVASICYEIANICHSVFENE